MKVVTSRICSFFCGAIPYHKIKVSEYSTMNRRWHWREVLDAEMRHWSALPYDQLMARLSNADVYEVKHDSRTYQVEIEVLENTENYVHVVLSVDDGSLPASIWPATDSFICIKPNLSD